MEAINWEAVQAISEALGLLVVVGSLIFVGLQIQQNTEAARIDGIQNITSEWRSALQGMLTTEQSAELIFQGCLDRDRLAGAELFQFYGTMHTLFYVMSNAYYHHRKGVLDDETFIGIRNYFRLMVELPGVAAYWESRREIYPETFQRYFTDEVIAKSESKLLAEYKTSAEKI